MKQGCNKCIVCMAGLHSQEDARFLVAPQNTHHVIGQVKPLYLNASLDARSEEFVTWDVYTSYNVTSVTHPISAYDSDVRPQLANDYKLEGSNLIVKNVNFGIATTYGARSSVYLPFVNQTAEVIIFGK